MKNLKYVISIFIILFMVNNVISQSNRKKIKNCLSDEEIEKFSHIGFESAKLKDDPVADLYPLKAFARRNFYFDNMTVSLHNDFDDDKNTFVNTNAGCTNTEISSKKQSRESIKDVRYNFVEGTAYQTQFSYQKDEKVWDFTIMNRHPKTTSKDTLYHENDVYRPGMPMYDMYYENNEFGGYMISGVSYTLYHFNGNKWEKKRTNINDKLKESGLDGFNSISKIEFKDERNGIVVASNYQNKNVYLITHDGKNFKLMNFMVFDKVYDYTHKLRDKNVLDKREKAILSRDNVIDIRYDGYKVYIVTMRYDKELDRNVIYVLDSDCGKKGWAFKIDKYPTKFYKQLNYKYTESDKECSITNNNTIIRPHHAAPIIFHIYNVGFKK